MFQKRNKKIIAILSLMFLMLIAACSDDDDQNQSCCDKWTSGDYDSMTESEWRAMDDFLEWSNEN